MKKIFTFLAFVVTIVTFAQAPQGFNYQATVRDNAGQLLLNQIVLVKFNILQNSAAGTVVFSENQTANTDDLGHINLVVGSGTPSIGTFSTINWGTGSYYLGIELNTGTGFVAMGTTQLMSVPYALYANSAGGSTIANGTTVGEMLFWNGTQWALNPIGLPGQILYVSESNLPTWGFSPIIMNSSCFGSNNGAINLNLPAQISASYYTYNWTGPNNFSSNASNINNLSPGIYSLVLTHNGVSTTQNYSITEPQELLTVNTNNINVTCYGGNNGQCTVNVTQGSFGNYTFSISGIDYLGNNVNQNVTQSSTSYTFLGLSAGTYNIGVTTDSLCSNFINDVIINQPSAVISNIPGTYTVVVTRGDGVVRTYANEIITSVGINNYKTTTTGQWAAGTIAPDQAYNFKEVCGNLKVENQGLCQGYYSNQVYQTPTQLLNSNKNASTGVITIQYYISFAAGNQSYISVYTPN
jgi:trimeric autotransporter adhesin